MWNTQTLYYLRFWTDIFEPLAAQLGVQHMSCISESIYHSSGIKRHEGDVSH